jgi:hypothetical protein
MMEERVSPPNSGGKTASAKGQWAFFRLLPASTYFNSTNDNNSNSNNQKEKERN